MTPVFLLEELQKFISSKTSDIILPVRTRTGSSEEKERAAAVYKMGLPEADDVSYNTDNRQQRYKPAFQGRKGSKRRKYSTDFNCSRVIPGQCADNTG